MGFLLSLTSITHLWLLSAIITAMCLGFKLNNRNPEMIYSDAAKVGLSS